MTRTLLVILLLSACGGGQPRAEATWETNTTSSEDVEDEE